jgi:hypothetical protein
MHQNNSACFTRTNGSSLVLLARIVDSAGRPIPPSQVDSIEYLVLEHDSCRPEYSPRDDERPGTRLVVSDVLSPGLVNDDSWSVDVAGYNFRHEVAIGKGMATPTPSGRVELRYVFSSTDNIKSIIRFDLKLD